ncbi:riboflavin synthase [Thalassotalea agarivorans]|uniref:Riboflavin synthase n=1 Tax=Thalassotalea agarivorans TaxID=349064 RepID=A0A1I0APK3_THASX|nr:riboflavin synthase [Thalassotalea agarivorans]SES95695.1 riboflavin synthase alpha chain [Thalassotalea agarivorans]
MFTGIIESVGEVTQISPQADGARVTIAVNQLDMSDVKLGDSIASNGVCLTVVAFDKKSFSADISAETLSRTNWQHYNIGQRINLEKAMLPTTRFGGHMVSGHVDTVAKIQAIEHTGNSSQYWIEMGADIAPFIAEKGSVTIDGVSLTVNSVESAQFRLTIVPHTAAETIISHYKTGDTVNLEIDVIARYTHRLLQFAGKDMPQQHNSITEATLAKAGFIR